MKRFIFILLALCFEAYADTSVIAVSGTAEKLVDPNIVVLQVEVWGKATQAKVAQENVAKEYQRIKSISDKFKIKKEDFQTQGYNLAPEYNYDKGTQKVVGQRATHLIGLTLRKTDDAGALIDALSSNLKMDVGGVSIQSINWDFDKRGPIELSLLSDAVKNAKLEADELAKASNSKIKGVYKLSRVADMNMPVPVMSRSMKTTADSQEMASASEVSAGPVKIKVQVYVEYAIQ